MLKELFMLLLLLLVAYAVTVLHTMSNRLTEPVVSLEPPYAEYKPICIDGVEYLKVSEFRGIFPVHNTDGSLSMCADLPITK